MIKNGNIGKFENSNFGIDLDGSKYCVLPFPPVILIFMVGPKKYEISISKFIVVQRGPEAKNVTIKTVLLKNSFDMSPHEHLG